MLSYFFINGVDIKLVYNMYSLSRGNIEGVFNKCKSCGIVSSTMHIVWHICQMQKKLNTSGFRLKVSVEYR